MKLFFISPERRGRNPRFRRKRNPLWSPAVKVFSVLLAVTLAAHAAPSDPGKVAIDFLEKVRERKVNLEPGGDTALSPQTAAGKRRQIAKRLERIARDLGNDPLEVSAVKEDEDFAAVLVRKVGGFDASRLQVFPVALVKRDSEWEVAPVPASFENAGAGYAVALRKRLDQLEDWMLREQVVDLEKLRAQANQRMRARIEANLPESELRGFDARRIANRFLAACGKGDLPSVLGVIGGLDKTLPDDWSVRLKATEKALTAGSAVPRPWRLLAAPEVARVIVHDEDDGKSGIFSVACLDPVGTEKIPPQIEVVHFQVSKSTDGLWRINLPPSFLHEPAASTDERTDDPFSENQPDADLIEAFPSAWREAHPAVSQPTGELASKAWLDALGGGDFPAVLALLKLDGSPANAAKACIKAAQFWTAIRDGTSADVAIPLSFQEDETSAAGIYQFFTARDPDRLDLRSLYFEKSKDGWFWSVSPSQEIREKRSAWVDEETKRLPDVWQDLVLSSCPVLRNLDKSAAPTEEEARKCVEAWFSAIDRGDIHAAIAQMARLDGKRSDATALRNLGYEVSASRDQTAPAEISGIYQDSPWTAVGVRTHRDGGKSTAPLYPVVATPTGPRLLIEIDLFAADNRSRSFLNNDALERLRKQTSQAASSKLEDLLKAHQAAMEATPDKRPKASE